MEQREVFDSYLTPYDRADLQWKAQDGAVQFYESSRTGTMLAVDDTGRFYDPQMREIHPTDALAAVGFHYSNPENTERINAHVQESREQLVQPGAAPAEGAAIPPAYKDLDYSQRGMYPETEVELTQHRYTGGLVRHDYDDHFFDAQLRPISQQEALAGVVNYGPNGGTLEKLPPVDVEIIRPPAPEPSSIAISAEEYQTLRSQNGPDWRHSIRVETAPPGLDGHYANEPNLSDKYRDRIDDRDLYVYNQQHNFYSPQLYDSMVAMNGPDWQHRVIVGREELYTREETNTTYGWQRTAPEQNPATALSVEAAYPRDYIAPTYEQALERWENAVHLHEDLRGRPLTPQEYQQQGEINGPRWQHDLVMTQPVDATQNLYDRPYTQITLDDQTLSRGGYERLLEHNGPDWQHSVVVREPFPLDPDSRFQQAHRDWREVNEIYQENNGVPISPQEYQAYQERREWHQDSVVIVTPPLEPGLQQDYRAALKDSEMSQMPSLSHTEYSELLRTQGPEWQHGVAVLEPRPEHFGMELPTSWRSESLRIEHSPSNPEPQIVPYATTDWTVESGGQWEHRVHFGLSNEGHHYAPERSYLGGGEGELAWSAPYASHHEANLAAHAEIAQTISEDAGYSNGLSL